MSEITENDVKSGVSCGWVKRPDIATTTHDVWETPAGNIFPCAKSTEPVITIRGGKRFYEGLNIDALEQRKGDQNGSAI